MKAEYNSKDKVELTWGDLATLVEITWNGSLSSPTLEEILTQHDESSVLSIPPARLLFILPSWSAAIIDGFPAQQQQAEAGAGLDNRVYVQLWREPRSKRHTWQLDSNKLVI